jgi:hypothetical protein
MVKSQISELVGCEMKKKGLGSVKKKKEKKEERFGEKILTEIVC